MIAASLALLALPHTSVPPILHEEQIWGTYGNFEYFIIDVAPDQNIRWVSNGHVGITGLRCHWYWDNQKIVFDLGEYPDVYISSLHKFVPIHLPNLGAFLIEENSIPAFADYAKKQNYSKSASFKQWPYFAVRTESFEEDLVQYTTPVFDEYHKFGEIICTVTQVLEDNTFELKSDQAHRIKLGMRFCMDDFRPELQVISIGDSIRAKARFWTYDSDPVKVGDQGTTGRQDSRVLPENYPRSNQPLTYQEWKKIYDPVYSSDPFALKMTRNGMGIQRRDY